MVFDKNLDRALWLAMAYDKKNRVGIAGLIYKIPEELYFRIIEQLNDYLDSGEDLDYSFKEFRQAVRNKDNGDNYFYYVKMNPDEINIKLSKWGMTESRLEEKIELSLFPVSHKDLSNINPIEPINVGNYSYSGSQIIPFFGVAALAKECEYLIIDDNLVGVVMSSSFEDESFSIINLSKMPVDMEMADLKDRRSVNRLVKGRRKK